MQKRTYSVTALGELLIDFTDGGASASGQKLFERNPGGAPANVLVALSRLGHRTAFIGKVGQDLHGAFLRDELLRNGVACEGLVEDPRFFTTLAFVEIGDGGERRFSFARNPGADTQLTIDEVRGDLIRDCTVFHTGSLSLTDPVSRQATLEALWIAKENHCVCSFDPNYRPLLWKDREEAEKAIRSVLPLMDLAKVSDEETELATGVSDPEKAAERLVEGGAALACVTLGADGAIVASMEGSAYVPAFRTDPVDTTGAGDSFWGAFLASFLDTGKELKEVTLDDALGFCAFGCAAASLCVRKRGGIPAMPTRSEVEAVLAANSPEA